METRVLRLRITGLVQGVGFRAFVQTEAERLGVRGWVRNRRDRSVEAVIAGASEAVGELLVRCGRGPPGSQVEEVSVDEEISEPFGQSFAVLPTAP
jgi:acylphosphatase